MSDEIYALDQEFGEWVVELQPEVMAGYHRLAAPVVKLMQRSKLFTHAVNLLAGPWARQMAHLMGQGKGSIVGAAVMAVGVPLCRLAAPKTDEVWQ
jgi:hypothetical protein